MTIKLVLLKSGEDIIADVTEMVVGEEEERSIVGYFLDRPCVIRIRDPNLLNEEGPRKGPPGRGVDDEDRPPRGEEGVGAGASEVHLVNGATHQKGEYSPMSEETRKKLRGFFDKYNTELFELVGKKFDWNY